MPRQVRSDTPETLQHVMVNGRITRILILSNGSTCCINVYPGSFSTRELYAFVHVDHPIVLLRL